jgi:hypothetical protein
VPGRDDIESKLTLELSEGLFLGAPTTDEGVQSRQVQGHVGQPGRRARSPGAKSASRFASWPRSLPLPGVGVPALDVDEGDLEAHVGLDDLGDLTQLLAEVGPRVPCAVGRREALGWQSDLYLWSSTLDIASVSILKFSAFTLTRFAATLRSTLIRIVLFMFVFSL